MCRIQLQKKKTGVKKCLEICAIKGGGRGVGRIMANAILNFHFDYPHTSLKSNICIIIFKIIFLIIVMPGCDSHLDSVDDRCAVAASVGSGQRDDNRGEENSKTWC